MLRSVRYYGEKTKQGQSINEGNLFRATFMGPTGLKAWDGTNYKRGKEEREKKQSWNRQGHSWRRRDPI